MAAPRPPRRPRVAPGEFPYDTKRTPPAPLLLLRVGLPRTEPATAVAALVDSGADITVLPEGLPETLGLPQIGEVAVHGVGDAVRRVPVYAAELKAVGWRGIVEVAGIGGESLLGRDGLNAGVVMLDRPRPTLRGEWDWGGFHVAALLGI